jgi:hypothetical protein
MHSVNRQTHFYATVGVLLAYNNGNGIFYLGDAKMFLSRKI